ncbi:hypothetical protein K474DRAFT_1711485, partial [Panus rudis PR-1116 ss-1]
MSTPPPSPTRAEPPSSPSARSARGGNFNNVASSPVETVTHVPDRQAVQNSPLVQQATQKASRKGKEKGTLVANFVSMHLNELPQEIKEKANSPAMRALLNTVTSCKAEAAMYKPTEHLLNKISGIIYDYLKKEKAANENNHGPADSNESSSDECNDNPKYVDRNRAAKWRRGSRRYEHPSRHTPADRKHEATASKDIRRNTRKKTVLKRLTFLDHHDGATAYHPDNSSDNDKADLIGIWGDLSNYTQYQTGKNRSYLKVPSYEVVSIIELKPQRGQSSGDSQAISYLWDHRKARPDMPGVYALYANVKEYQIIWADAEGPILSNEVAWKDFELEPLFAYVYSIYKPPKGHHIFDPTIQPSHFPVAG